MDLRVLDNGGKNIKLDQAEFIDMSPLSRDSRFSIVASSVKKGNKYLVGWLKYGSKYGLQRMNWK